MGFTYFLYNKRKANLVRTSLILQVGNNTVSHSWKVLDLQFNPGHYRLLINQGLVATVLDEYYFSGRLSWNSGVAVMNKFLNMPVILPEKLKVRFYDMKIVRSILARQYYVILYVVEGQNMILDDGILKPWLTDEDRRFSGTSQSPQSGLYPVDMGGVARKLEQCPSY